MRRCALIAVAAIGLVQPAFAGGDILRGSSGFELGAPTYARWSGFYFGGQVGLSAGTFDFGASSGSLFSYILRESVLEAPVSAWRMLPTLDSTGLSYGGFVGYNFQFDSVLVGIEANYNRTSLRQSARDSLSRSLVNPAGSTPPSGHTYTYNVTATSDAWAHLTDFGTVRARAGWVAGPFMPYVFAGVAVGRADVYRSAAVSGTLDDSYSITQILTDPITGQLIPVVVPVTDTYALTPGQSAETKMGAFAYGYTFGLGMDFAVLDNVFIRGEWEWVEFAALKDIKMHVNTLRSAVGVKF